ncbi:hypothetical protein Hdeb2414_s0083g00781631 [Helianthus debilis subsp. tardiflorus]
METRFNDSKPMTVPTHTQVPDRMNIYLNNNHNANGKRTFHAKATKSITNCYTIEMVIDGKPLRGVLFSNNFGSKKSTDDLRRKRVAVDSGKKDFEQLMADTTRSSELQTPSFTSAASEMKTPAASNVSPSHEVSVDKKSSMEFNKMNTSAAAEDTANSFHNRGKLVIVIHLYKFIAPFIMPLFTIQINITHRLWFRCQQKESKGNKLLLNDKGHIILFFFIIILV